MDLIYFYASKLLWPLFSPDHILILLLLIGLVYLFKRAFKKSLVCLCISMTIILTVTFLPVGHWLLHPIETRFPVINELLEPPDGILVLAGAENIHLSVFWGQPEFNQSAERIFAFIGLINRFPHARHAFIGGTGSVRLQQHKSEQVIRHLFKQLNMDTRSIEFESASKNTYENAQRSFQLLQPQKGERWLLVTSASHMPRSVGVFRKAGWNVIPYPVDHTVRKEKSLYRTFNFAGNLSILKKAAREWTGLFVYYLTGKTDQLFPGP
jgi:uncharacterized SAM-binding protein YcdF (DUF218 family)